jgi:hypothetical protein
MVREGWWSVKATAGSPSPRLSLVAEALVAPADAVTEVAFVLAPSTRGNTQHVGLEAGNNGVSPPHLVEHLVDRKLGHMQIRGILGACEHPE